MYEEDEDKRHKKHNDKRELELLTIRNIMGTENGRHFMWQCLQNCCTFSGVFNIDSRQHAYNEGKRSHGLWLDSQLKEASPDNYHIMLKEHIDE